MKLSQKNKIHSLIIAISLAFFALVLPVPVYGTTPVQSGASSAKGQGQPDNLFGTSGIFNTLTNTMLFIIGALSVIMLIFGGLRYIISGGNATAITAAKNTILYAIVGLIVALLAYAAINFVLATLIPGSGTGGTNI